MHIRGHNGKIYPYLVVNDSGLSDARREERVLQLLRMLNHLLGKHKETSRRFLNMTVARVVAVSPQMRLVQVESNIRHEDFRSSVRPCVTLMGPPLDSETGWTGELWSNPVLLILEN